MLNFVVFPRFSSVECYLSCSETFPSGCLTLDFALGGGLPKGRVVEVTFIMAARYLPNVLVVEPTTQ